MKLKTIYYLPLALLAVLTLCTSCIMDDENGCPPVDLKAGESYKIRFVFTTTGTSPATRATRADGNGTASGEDSDNGEDSDIPGDEGDAPGEGRENYIDVSKTHFYLFTSDAKRYDEEKGEEVAAPYNDTFLAELVPSTIGPKGVGAFPTEWEVVAKISDAQSKPLTYEQLMKGFKLVCLANVDLPSNFSQSLTSGTGGTTLQEMLSLVTYSFHPFTRMQDVLIPMYGVLTVKPNTRFIPNLAVNVGDLNLLRAMARIKLVCESEKEEGLEEGATLQFVNARLNHREQYRQYGYVAPMGTNPPDGVYANTKEDWQWGTTLLAGRKVFIPGVEAHDPFYYNGHYNDANGASYKDNPIFAINPCGGDHGDHDHPIHFDFMLIPDKNGNKTSAVIYVPEFDNVSNELKNKLTFTISLTSDPTDPTKAKEYGPFTVAYYKDGEVRNDANAYFNIVRNYSYTFNLRADIIELNLINVGISAWEPYHTDDTWVYNW